MPWIAVVVWHGTTAEAAALEIAIKHNCACAGGGPCGAHEAMLSQRWLDGVLFARFMRERLLREEGVRCVKRS